jgi:hypothetical protein
VTDEEKRQLVLLSRLRDEKLMLTYLKEGIDSSHYLTWLSAKDSSVEVFLQDLNELLGLK